MNGRSTNTNLTAITQYVSEYLNDQFQTEVTYTDLIKAFDRVDRHLLEKFVSFEVSHLLILTQYVIGSNCKSSQYIALGVPLSSNLEQLQFSIFRVESFKHCQILQITLTRNRNGSQARI